MPGVAPFIAMVVTEEPDAVAEPSVELTQESLKPVVPILAPELATQPLSKGSRRLVSHNVVNFPAHAVERGAAVLHLFLARHLLGPPAPPLPAILPVVARGTAHGKDREPVDIEHLPAHQVQHVRSRLMDEPAVPLPHRQPGQGVVVLMVAVYETRGPGLRFEPVEPVFLGVGSIPDKAEVAGHDHCVIARQGPAQWPRPEGEPAGPVLGPAVHVACHIDRHRITPFRLYVDSLIKQKDVLVGNNELEGLKNAVDAADRERLDANERLREAEKTLKDSKVQAIAYLKCIEALDLKLSNRIDLLDPADETIDILERIFPSESDARGVSHLGFDSLIKYIDEQEKKFLSDLRKESKGKQSAVIAAQREVEREMKYCKEAFGASTPELDHVDTDIRDIAAYLSMDLSGSEQALVDMFASNLPKINLAFKNFSECEREYETDVLSAFSTINGILKRYPFRSDGAALEIKPTFQKNTSA